MKTNKEKTPQNKNITTQLKNFWHLKIKSIIATFVTALFIIVIAISFGRVPGCDTTARGQLAVVNGKTILNTSPQFKRNVEQLQKYYKNIPYNIIEKQALRQVIGYMLMLDAAKDNKIKLPPKVHESLILGYLKQEKISPQNFASRQRGYRKRVEKYIKENYLTSVLRYDIVNSSKSTEIEFRLKELVNSISAAVDIIVLDTDKIIQNIKVSDNDLKIFFNKNKNRYSTMVKASKILVADKNKAQQIKTRLDNKEDFANLAKNYSLDSASSYSGGNMGWIFPLERNSAESTALLKLKPGEISSPVKTSLGYTIFKVEKKSTCNSFNKMDKLTKVKLTQAYKNINIGSSIQIKKKAEMDLHEIKKLVKNNKSGFRAAAAGKGFRVLRSSYFKLFETPNVNNKNMDLSSIQDNYIFYQQVFSIKRGTLTSVIRIKNKLVLAQLIGRKKNLNKNLKLMSDKKKFKRLPKRIKDKIKKEVQEKYFAVQNDLQRNLFDDWSASLWDNADIKVTPQRRQ